MLYTMYDSGGRLGIQEGAGLPQPGGQRGHERAIAVEELNPPGKRTDARPKIDCAGGGCANTAFQGLNRPLLRGALHFDKASGGLS